MRISFDHSHTKQQYNAENVAHGDIIYLLMYFIYVAVINFSFNGD